MLRAELDPVEIETWGSKITTNSKQRKKKIANTQLVCFSPQ
jgi:hypothetical protein